MSGMKEKVWPMLYRRTHTGAIIDWKICVNGDEACANIVVVFGQDNKQTTSTQITGGKNLGKANETTPYEQAINEAQGKWNKQKLNGYTESPNDKPTHILPMLAHKYQDRIGKVKFPCLCQPKLDGSRCIAQRVDGEILLTTRKGKPYPGLHDIKAELHELMREGDIWDGELYVPGIPFEKLASLSKKDTPEQSILEYHVFDVVDPSLPFIERFEPVHKLLAERCDILKCKVRYVSTDVASDHEEVLELHGAYVQAGYEGIMLRVGDCKYTMDHRSLELLKFKFFEDAEFEIVNVKAGRGRFAEAAVFTLAVGDHNQIFDCVMRGAMQTRQEQLTNAKEYIGKMMTVRYQNLSEYGIPRFPVGVRIVSPEEL